MIQLKKVYTNPSFMEWVRLIVNIAWSFLYVLKSFLLQLILSRAINLPCKVCLRSMV